ncbi:MAG: hypothetical protein PHY93_08505, partial [Bacteriovorax sp.]|nr:hypothetical protein [Bacteriovorax sp.]
NAEFIKSKIPYISANESDLQMRYSLFFDDTSSKDHPKCFYCEEQQTEWDHLISPLKKKKDLEDDQDQASGYFHEVNNLIPSCHSCNSSKGNTHFEDWMLSTSVKAKHNLIRKHIKSGLEAPLAEVRIKEKIALIKSVLDKNPPTKIDFETLLKDNLELTSKESELKRLQLEISKISKEASRIAQSLSEHYSKILSKGTAHF